MPAQVTVTLDEQIEEITKELNFRRIYCGTQTRAGKMTKAGANQMYGRLAATLHLLQELRTGVAITDYLARDRIEEGPAL